MPYVDLFFYLRQRTDWQKECKLISRDNLVMSLTAENKKTKSCCSACDIGRRCIKCTVPKEDEIELELEIAPPREDRDPSSSHVWERSIESGRIIEPDSTRTGEEVNETPEVIVHTPVSRRTRQQSHLLAPLRQGVGEHGPVYVKVPSSITDLMAWKQAAGVYREDPERVGRVVETIIRTQDPDWNDLQVILDNLLDSTEKQMVLKTGKAQAEAAHMNETLSGTLEQSFPSGDPQWDPNDPVDRRRLTRYQRWVLCGVKHAMPKALNWSKLYEIKQDKNESPSVFLEKLKETARKYTDLKLETEAEQQQLASIFMGQSAPDIRRKLQKLEGEDSRNLNKMLETAWKVYNNREKEEEQRREKKEKVRESRLIAVLTGGTARGRGRTRGRGGFKNFGNRDLNAPLGINQCAYCRENGHWKKDCPQLQTNQQEVVKMMTLDE